MRALILIALALPACWPTVVRPVPACVTRCGLRILPPVPAGWCAEIQPFEDQALGAYAQVPDPRFRQACQVLGSWAVMVAAQRNFNSSSEFQQLDDGGWQRLWVGGETHCEVSTVIVGNAPPAVGRLGHELAHAIQGCSPLPPVDPTDPFHSNWVSIWGALSDAGLPL